MPDQPHWPDLAEQLDRLSEIQPLRVDWHAYGGSEEYGIWIFRPEGSRTDAARAKFSLIAAQAIEKLGVPTVPVPEPHQHCPHWGEPCQAEEQLAQRVDKTTEATKDVPYGLGLIDADAVDPCTRAWLELLRKNNGTVRISEGWEVVGTTQYNTLSGTIDDPLGVSAAYCRRRERDEIGNRIKRRSENDLPPRLQPLDVSKLPRPRNRMIVTYLASDAVADIKIPWLEYSFPEVFSPIAQANIMAGRLRAENVLRERKGGVRQYAAAEQLLINFILTVFAAFAEECRKLAVKGVIAAQTFESECLAFLRAYARAAGLMDRFMIPISGHSDIPDNVQHKIERSDEWKEYRQILEGVARSQGSSTQELVGTKGPPTLEPDRPSPKGFVDIAKRQPKRSYEKFAAHIGIGKDTLYAITKETRWVSDETYVLVAQACKCRPEDPHPRDIPRPERNR